MGKKAAAGCGVLGSSEVPFDKRRSVSGSCLNKAGLNPSVHWSQCIQYSLDWLPLLFYLLILGQKPFEWNKWQVCGQKNWVLVLVLLFICDFGQATQWLKVLLGVTLYNCKRNFFININANHMHNIASNIYISRACIWGSYFEEFLRKTTRWNEVLDVSK